MILDPGNEKSPHRHRWKGGTHHGAEAERMDELLELIWKLREEGVSDVNQLLNSTQDAEARSILRQMVRDDLFQVDGDRMILKERGEEKAREIIRRHRLTERLFSEIFEMSEDEAEEEACRLEHSLTPAATESVCTFLGHPPTCMQGTGSRGRMLCQVQKGDETPGDPLEELGLGRRDGSFIVPKVSSGLDRLSTWASSGKHRPGCIRRNLPCLQISEQRLPWTRKL
jgi:DtxR family Mn-dependent transcriptional regulator